MEIRFGAVESLVTQKSRGDAACRGPFGGVYANRRVLVTGDTGFKGSWLCLWLVNLGAQVAGYALPPPTEPSHFESVGLVRDIAHTEGDVRDFESLKAAIEAFQPEIVFNLAAQPLVRRSYDEPRLTFETNIMGCVNLLEAVRLTKSVTAVINVTSDKCYENRGGTHAYTEQDPLGGHDPYSSSKGCAELVTSAYRRSFFMEAEQVRLASARAGNVIGGGDWAADRVVPDCVRALVSGSPLALRNPRAIRPWQHVLESLSGYLWLGSRMMSGGHDFDGPWNFGPGEGVNVPVAKVVNLFLDAWGGCEWAADQDRSAQPHEAKSLVLDCSKAKERLGWQAIWGVEEAVRQAAVWYRLFYETPDHARRERLLRTQACGDIDSYLASAQTAGAPWALGTEARVE